MPVRLTVRDLAAQDAKDYELDFDTTVISIGRASVNSVQLPNRRISHTHCRILAEGKDYYLVDSGSTNGTQLNGKRIPVDERKLLRDGDHVQIESFDLKFSVLQAVPRSEEAGERTEMVARRMVMEVLSALGDETPSIKVVTGPQPGLAVELAREVEDIVIGRSSECDLWIDHKAISRQHARVRKDWNGVVVVDLGSANGVFVNDERVYGERRLRDRDEIRLGAAIKLVFSDPNAALMDELDDIPDPVKGASQKAAALPASAPPPPPVPPPLPDEIEVPEPEMPIAGGTMMMKVPADFARRVQEEQQRIQAVQQQAVKTPTGSKAVLAVFAIAAVALVAIGVAVVMRLPAAPPVLESITPRKTIAGNPVVVSGTGFGEKDSPEALRLLFGTVEAKIDQREEKQLHLRVPTDAPDGAVTLTAFRGEIASVGELAFVKMPKPSLDSVDPDSAKPGQMVTLRGEGFSPEPFENEVRFGSERAQVTEGTPTELKAVVPNIAASGPVNVSVAVHGLTSDASELSIVGVKPPPFLLAFSAGRPSADGSTISVNTDFGPILYLSEGAGSEGLEARARRVAERLNAARKALSERPTAKLKLRGGGAGGEASIWQVTPDGSLEEKLADVTAADAAGYSRQAGVRIDPDQLGAWWVGLLSDYYLVFVQRRPPAFTPDSSADTRVLAEVNAMSPGAPFPREIASQLSPAQQESLARAARALPARYGRVDGRWSGQIDIRFSRASNEGLYEATLMLDQNGTSVSGTANLTRSKKIGNNAIRYERKTTSVKRGAYGATGWNEVTFVLTNPEGEDVTFRGTVQGKSLTGTFVSAGGDRSGKFELTLN
ncbi:MAG: FHA domain-containing protein [Candidatus Schekmanbacteria bacterium]|nr:FHA domain-containing protein [Candidatus Schekmanbacteria bacterium]